MPQDYAEAAKWFRKPAAQSHAKAQYNLGLLYDVGLKQSARNISLPSCPLKPGMAEQRLWHTGFGDAKRIHSTAFKPEPDTGKRPTDLGTRTYNYLENLSARS